MSLPDSHNERAAALAAALTADERAEQAELARAEGIAFAAREARRASTAKRQAEHDAHARKLADAFAAGFFPKLAELIRVRAEEPNRRQVPLIAQLIQVGAAEAALKFGDQETRGGALPTTWPAAAFISALLDARPELVDAAMRWPEHVHSCSAAVIRLALTGNVPAIESALFALEEAVTTWAAAHATFAPSAEARAIWSALLTSGRHEDFDERVRQLGERRAVEQGRAVRDLPAPKTDDADADADVT